MSLANLKAGDEVVYTISDTAGTTRRVEKIEKVTPTGRLIVNGIAFNPDGSGRGDRIWGPHRSIEPATPALRQQVADGQERRALVITLREFRWATLSLPQLRAVVACLPEPRKRKA